MMMMMEEDRRWKRRLLEMATWNRGNRPKEKWRNRDWREMHRSLIVLASARTSRREHPRKNENDEWEGGQANEEVRMKETNGTTVSYLEGEKRRSYRDRSSRSRATDGERIFDAWRYNLPNSLLTKNQLRSILACDR